MAGKIYEVALKLCGGVDASVGKAFASTKDSMAALSKSVKTLQDTSGQMKSWRSLAGGVRDTTGQLKAARGQLESLARQGYNSSGATRQMAREFSAAETRVKNLARKLQTQRGELHQVSAALKSAGVSTRDYGREQDRLAEKIGRLDALRGKMQSIQGRIDANEARKSVLKGRLGVLGSVLPAAAGMFSVGKAVTETAGFEEAMNKHEANGADAEQRGRLAAFYRERGRATRFSATTYANAGNDLMSFGFGEKEIEAGLEGIAKGAVATGTGFEDMKKAGVASLKAFDKPASELTNVIAVLSVTSNKTGASVGELSETFAEAAPLAKQLAVNESELAAMAGVLADNGLKGAKSGAALKKMLLGLTEPSESVTKRLAGLGVNADRLFRYSDGNARSFKAIFTDLNEITRGMGDAEKLNLYRGIFGDKAAAAAMDMARKVASGRFAELADEAAKDSLAVLEKMKNSMDKGLNASLARLGASAKSVLLSFGGAFGGDLATGIDAVARKLGSLSRWLEENKEWAGRIAKVVSSLLAFRLGLTATELAARSLLGPFLKGWKTLTKFRAAAETASGGMKMLGTAGKLAKTAFAALGSPIGMISLGIGGLVAAGYYLYKNWDKISAWCGKAWNWLGDQVRGVVEWFEAIPEKVKKAWENVKKFIDDSNAEAAAAAPAGALVAPPKGYSDASGRFAGGGRVGGPTVALIGEGDSPEYVIPVQGRHKRRGLALWQAAGRDLGVPGLVGGGYAAVRRVPKEKPIWDNPAFNFLRNQTAQAIQDALTATGLSGLYHGLQGKSLGAEGIKLSAGMGLGYYFLRPLIAPTGSESNSKAPIVFNIKIEANEKESAESIADRVTEKVIRLLDEMKRRQQSLSLNADF
ncbi:phage tail tape measure protein [uncultured Pyramidobacter sp.]|nr:phage tail tape measure protein [uncultured Pyramidobacter sp.]